MDDIAEFEGCARRLKALADPERLRIVTALMSGRKNVSDLSAELGDDIVKVSHHLSVLRHANIVLSERDGRFIFYQLHPELVKNTRASRDLIDLGCCRLEIPR